MAPVLLFALLTLVAGVEGKKKPKDAKLAEVRQPYSRSRTL